MNTNLARLCLMMVAVLTIVSCENKSEMHPTETPIATSSPASSASQSTIPTPEPTSTTSPHPTNIPIDKVRIMLEEEPRMPSNASALVSSASKHWIIDFSESMNRTSVEETLKRNLLQLGSTSNTVDIKFEWMNDRQLKVITSLRTTEVEANRVIYTISVNGASTTAGAKLEQTSEFRATVGDIKQIYRISIDGKSREKLSSFDKPYFLNKVPNDAGYMFTTQNTYYCECDARSKALYDLFDYGQRTHVSYPVELYTSYVGEGGKVVADTKGFFYTNPQGLKMPESRSEYHISLDGYLFGTGISKDRRYAFIVRGEKGQKTDFDFILLNLETGQQEVYAKTIKGNPPSNQISDGTLPISFNDDGKQVTFIMENTEPWGYERYAFNWDQRTVKPLASPDGEVWWSVNMTSDGVFQLSNSGDLYKNGVKQNKPKEVSYGTWINNSHKLMMFEVVAGRSNKLTMYDADSKQITPTNIILQPDENVIGTSSDGNWIYVSGK
ncbi:hypothetical protein [Paenibacillus sp. Soil766]|uniref:hypothetical protein n=1 Tax=Paenibacillus sp. Soil766 TaxID=1736404 RepID=UPI0012FBBA04|nr:hypothetical protein [Paenibacillus sp. Soil766]